MKSNPSRPPLDAAAFRTVCSYSVAHLIPPDDVVRVAAGRRSREPFLIAPEQLSTSYKDKMRFLSILAALYDGDKSRFEKSAPEIRGTRRRYFGHTADEVSSTGTSNWPAKIPSTHWYVSINNAAERKRRIVYDLMTRMQFSSEYAQMVASLCANREARLPRFYRDALAKLPAI